MKRRQFLHTLAATAAAPLVIPREVFGGDGTPSANERIGVAGIGVGRQGSYVFFQTLKDKRTQAVCVADVFLPRAQSIAKRAGLSGDDAAYQDYRRLLERNDVDAVISATPEHWRLRTCVDSARAGKHIYVEKPMSLKVSEGRAIVDEAHKAKVVVQTGSMQRSMRANAIGCKFIREGGLGKISEVIAANYESPWEAALPEAPVPDGLDWKMWLGDAPFMPYHPDLFAPRANPGWLSFRPFSGGEVTGWGTHGLDQIQCALGMENSGPVEIIVTGEKLVPPTYTAPESRDRGNKLCSQPRLAFRYENGIVVHLGTPEGRESNRGGAIFVGEKGKMEIFRGRITSNPAELAQTLLKESPIRDQSHTSNWLDCILSGETPESECEVGHRTASLCHILNIARYVGRSLKWNPTEERFIGDDDANALL
ncbi:MAG: Gfo/Idh/MocA family oxidoreductase [Planctomycetia bacterium]|nr:Gfo/Idh/MocA family oxidoreductase [Planctomycetia bacterium]